MNATALVVVGALLTASCSEEEQPVGASVLGDMPIVFTSDRAGTDDLWVMDADGGLLQLTAQGGSEASPEWSPDGTQVVFSADGGGDTTDIFVVDADGGNMDQITDTDACEDHPAWSPDGTQLLVDSMADCEDELTASLVAMGDDGSNAQQIRPAPAMWPDWSPNGRHIVYTQNLAAYDWRIWVSDPDGSDAAPLELPGIHSPSEPSWAPDSKRIAFVSPTDTYAHANPADWNEDIYVVGAGDTGIERITTSAGNDHWPPAWSSDGDALVYSSDGTEAEQGDLMAIDLDTREVTRLTDTASNEVLADWKQQ